MKALTLRQPWASLIACRAKLIETRTWGTSYRGPIAIHSARRWTPHQLECANNLIKHARLDTKEAACLIPPKLARIVCVADLVQCRLMDSAWISEQHDRELILGNWIPGNWGWVLENVRLVDPPLRVRGHQRLWNLTPGQAKKVAERTAA